MIETMSYKGKMKRILSLFIVLLTTTFTIFAAELKGKDVGDKWILSNAKGINVVSKSSEDGKAVFSVANINGQLVAIVTNNTDKSETNKDAVPLVRELKVLGMDNVGYENNVMLVGNNYFQYLEYWQILNLNVDNIKIVMQDRANNKIESIVNMKGYINALKKVYTGGLDSKKQDKYTGYVKLNNGWLYRETPEFKEISKEFEMLPGLEKDYGQLRNRMVIRNYNGVLWGGFIFSRPFDMRLTPSEIELQTEKSGDTVYVVAPVGSLDTKPQDIKIMVTKKAIDEMKASERLAINVFPSKEGDLYQNGLEPSEVDLIGFTAAMKKLGKYRVTTVEDLK
ncbi:MAG: hypothetical protein KA384_07365 [Leptotrichiaceae bacterium]|nr:hypothetical protein [Leptotrichiaceae bacterium]